MKRTLVALALVLAACAPRAPASHPKLGFGFVTPGGGFVPPTKSSSGGGGTGTVTSITAGTGLTGGTITTTGTIAADTTYLQRRVTGTCTGPNAITTINADGTVSCSTNATSSSLTSGDLAIATGTNAIGNYAGSSPTACTSGNVLTDAALSAAGALSLTCTAIGAQGGVTGGSFTTNDLIKATGASSVGNSGISDDGTTVSTSEALSVVGAVTLNSGGASSTTISGTANLNGLVNTGSRLTTIGTGGLTSTSGANTVGELNKSWIDLAISGTVNDWNPTGLANATLINVSDATEPGTITGIAGGTDGRRLTICALGSANTIFLSNENTNSAAANRLDMDDNTAWRLDSATSPNGSCVDLVYRASDSRWHQIETTELPALSVLNAFTASSSGLAFAGNVAGGGFQINNIANPSSAQDAATKSYVDSALTTDISGSTNTVPKFTGTNTIGNSSITDNGTTVTIGDSALTLATVGSDTITFGNGASDLVKVTGELQLLGGAATQLSVSGPASLSGTVTASGATVTIGSSSATTHLVDTDGSNRPTLSGCGTSPTIVGDDNSGYVIIGTGGATACTITFHTAFSKATCVMDEPASSSKGTYTVPPITTSITYSATLGATVKLVYDCRDH